MVIKYKLGDVAKDFNVDNKKISDVLKKHLDAVKKAQNALEDSELDVVFEAMTQEAQLDSFDSYFATQKSDEQRALEKAKSVPSDAGAGKPQGAPAKAPVKNAGKPVTQNTSMPGTAPGRYFSASSILISMSGSSTCSTAVLRR